MRELTIIVSIILVAIVFLGLWISGVFSRKAAPAVSLTSTELTAEDLQKMTFTVTPSLVNEGYMEREYYTTDNGAPLVDNIRDVNERLSLKFKLSTTEAGLIGKLGQVKGFEFKLMGVAADKIPKKGSMVESAPGEWSVTSNPFTSTDFSDNDVRDLTLQVTYNPKNSDPPDEFKDWGTPLPINDDDDKLGTALINIEASTGKEITIPIILDKRDLDNSELSTTFTVGGKPFYFIPYNVWKENSSPVTADDTRAKFTLNLRKAKGNNDNTPADNIYEVPEIIDIGRLVVTNENIKTVYSRGNNVSLSDASFTSKRFVRHSLGRFKFVSVNNFDWFGKNSESLPDDYYDDIYLMEFNGDYDDYRWDNHNIYGWQEDQEDYIRFSELALNDNLFDEQDLTIYFLKAEEEDTPGDYILSGTAKLHNTEELITSNIEELEKLLFKIVPVSD